MIHHSRVIGQQRKWELGVLVELKGVTSYHSLIVAMDTQVDEWLLPLPPISHEVDIL